MSEWSCFDYDSTHRHEEKSQRFEHRECRHRVVLQREVRKSHHCTVTHAEPEHRLEFEADVIEDAETAGDPNRKRYQTQMEHGRCEGEEVESIEEVLVYKRGGDRQRKIQRQSQFRASGPRARSGRAVDDSPLHDAGTPAEKASPVSVEKPQSSRLSQSTKSYE